jgi:thioredoxin reductase (NADPH)
MNELNIAIIGAGPIGIELAIALHRMNVAYTLFEAEQIGSFIAKWPPNTHFFSTPEHVALAGIPFHNLDQQTPTGEQYLAYLRMLVEMYDLNVRLYEPITRLRASKSGFYIQTQTRGGQQDYHARIVVLATGGMDQPRQLNIPGENLPHVTHWFPGPHPYFRQRILIVGGKNSAAEAALRCWRAGATVTMSYRHPEFNFDRVKPHLSMDLNDRLNKGEIQFLPATMPVEITPTHVMLASTKDGITPNGTTIQHKTDFVYFATGFEANMCLFEQVGAELTGSEQSPVYNEATMETTVPNLYVAGTAAGGTQQKKFRYFISTCHDHVIKIVKDVVGEMPAKIGTVSTRNNAITYQEVKAN